MLGICWNNVLMLSSSKETCLSKKCYHFIFCIMKISFALLFYLFCKAIWIQNCNTIQQHPCLILKHFFLVYCLPSSSNSVIVIIIIVSPRQNDNTYHLLTLTPDSTKSWGISGYRIFYGFAKSVHLRLYLLWYVKSSQQTCVFITSR